MEKLYFDGNWHGYIEVTTEVLAQNNIDATTPVRVSVYIGQDAPNATDVSDVGAYIGFSMGNQNKYLYFGELQLNGNKRFLGTLDFVLKHDDDGNVDSTLSIWSGETEGIAWTEGGLYWGSLNHKKTIAVPRIIRSGIIESVSNVTYLGENVTVKIKDNETGLKHQVWYRAFNSNWIDLGNNIGNEITFKTDRELYKKAGNSATGHLDISVRTFKNGKQYGGDVYKNGIPIKIPENIIPSVGSIKLIDKYTKREIETGAVVLKHLSDIEYEVMNDPNSLTEPVEWHLSINEKHFTGKKGEIGKLNKTGKLYAKAWVVDKHGRESIPYLKPFTISEYRAPQLSFVARRSGTKKNTVTVTTTAKIIPLKGDNGRQYNSFSLEFYTRRIEDTQFIKNEGASLKSTSTYELIEHSANLNGTFNSEQSYVIKAVLRDSFQEVEYLFPLSTEQVVASYSQWGMGIGKVWERGTLDVGGDIYSHNELVQVGRLTQINGKSIQLTGSANDATKTGLFYAYNMRDLPPNLDSYQRYGYLQVNTHPNDENFAMQIYIPHNTNVMYMRRKMNTYGWQPWVKFTPSDIEQQKDEWHDAPLTNGWRHYGGDDTNVQYRRDSEGRICLRGSCQGGTYINRGGTIFTLPKEYNPNKKVYIRAITGDYQECYLILSPVGELYCATDNQVKSDWLCLDGITI